MRLLYVGRSTADRMSAGAPKSTAINPAVMNIHTRSSLCQTPAINPATGQPEPTQRITLRAAPHGSCGKMLTFSFSVRWFEEHSLHASKCFGPSSDVMMPGSRCKIDAIVCSSP